MQLQKKYFIIKEESIIENNKEKHLLLPKHDVVFQSLFGRQGNEKILAEFISSIIGQKVNRLLLNKNQVLTREHPDDKLGILDLIATINEGEIVNIEVQLQNQHNLGNRILFYWMRIFSQELQNGENYNKIKKIISIVLVDYKSQELIETGEVHNICTMKNQNGKFMEMFKAIELHIIDMPRMLEHNIPNSKLKKWVQFLLEPESEEVKMNTETDMTLDEAYEQYNRIMGNEYLRNEIEYRWLKKLDDNTREEYYKEIEEKAKKDKKNLKRTKEEIKKTKAEIKTAKAEIKTAKAEIKTAKAEIKTTKAENRKLKEQNKKIQEQSKKTIAKKLLNKGLEIEEIASITNLSIKEVKELAK